MYPCRFAAVLVLMTSFCLVPAYAEWVLDETPADAGNWGYRPSADYPAEAVNPPGFSWRPTSGAKAYTLEVARDRDFDDIVYRVERTPWSAHGPTAPFEPGAELHWRYAVFNEEGARTPWSAVRSFMVTPGAVEFVKPSLDDMVAHLSREHPRLWFTKDDIPRLLKLADGPLKDRFEALVAQADRLLESPPDTSEPPLYPAGIEVKGPEWREIWWGNRRRVIAVTDNAALLGFVYQLTGDVRYGDAGKDLLMAFAQWDPKGSTEYNYNDEAGMPAIKYPSRAYSWCRDRMSLDERTRMATVMRERGRQCYENLQRRPHLWNPYGSHQNRAWHFLGELAVAFIDDIPEAPEWLEWAATVFYTCYPVWGDSDGGWHEGLAYWSSYLTRFNFWTLLMRSAFDIDIYERPFFQQTGYFAMFVSPPGSEHSGFGDLAERPGVNRNAARTAAIMAAGARNAHWRWYAETIGEDLPNDYFGFLLAAGADELEARAPDDLPASKCFHGVGIAAMNTNIMDARDNVQVLFKSSPMGSVSHGHNANNHFMLSIGGEPALLHTGSRDIHGSPHHTKWMWSTRSQNAILVNGDDQRTHSASAIGRIAAFHTTPELDVVAGEAGDSYQRLDRWTRTMVFLKPDRVVIHDRLEAPAPAEYDWLLHAPAAFAIDGDTAAWRGERGSVVAEFVYPKGMPISQTDGYDPPPHEWSSVNIDEWHLTARPQRPAPTQDFVVVLRINDAPEGIVHTHDDASHTVTVEGRGERLVFTADGFTIIHDSGTIRFDRATGRLAEEK